MSHATRLPLFDAACDQARHTFNARCIELRSMRASLALLDEHMPALRELGLRLHPSSIHWSPESSALSISTWHCCDAAHLHHALLSLGFKEVARRAYASFIVLGLKSGRLKINLQVPAAEAAA